jgi:2-dehydro-3-deoxygluconokinase
MGNGLNIMSSAAIDLLCLGALVHRFDPGLTPFRKADQYRVHVSGAEYNFAANFSDCFRGARPLRLPW